MAHLRFAAGGGGAAARRPAPPCSPRRFERPARLQIGALAAAIPAARALARRRDEIREATAYAGGLAHEWAMAASVLAGPDPEAGLPMLRDVIRSTERQVRRAERELAKLLPAVVPAVAALLVGL